MIIKPQIVVSLTDGGKLYEIFNHGFIQSIEKFDTKQQVLDYILNEHAMNESRFDPSRFKFVIGAGYYFKTLWTDSQKIGFYNQARNKVEPYIRGATGTRWTVFNIAEVFNLQQAKEYYEKEGKPHYANNLDNALYIKPYCKEECGFVPISNEMVLDKDLKQTNPVPVGKKSGLDKFFEIFDNLPNYTMQRRGKRR
jgi:hypothetical protein